MALPSRDEICYAHHNTGTNSPTRKSSKGQSHPLGADSTNTKSDHLLACRKETLNSKLNKMKRQRNMQQMKGHGENPQGQTNEEEIGNLPEKEFRAMIVKMI